MIAESDSATFFPRCPTNQSKLSCILYRDLLELTTYMVSPYGKKISIIKN